MAKSSNFGGKGGGGAEIKLGSHGPCRVPKPSKRDKKNFLYRLHLSYQTRMICRRILQTLSLDLPAQARLFLQRLYRLLKKFNMCALAEFYHKALMFLKEFNPIYFDLIPPLRAGPISVLATLYNCVEKSILALLLTFNYSKRIK
jgi:hypothetical protein